MSTAIVHYGRILRAKWRWLVWGVLVALLTATAVLIIQPPLYRSEALVFVRTPGDTSRVSDGGALYASLRSETFAIMAMRPDLSQRVISDLGLDLTPKQLASRIHARTRGGTSLIFLTVDASSPADAQRIAMVVISEWQSAVRDLESVPGISVPRAELAVVDPPDRAVRTVVWGMPIARALVGVILFGAAFGALGAVLQSIFPRAGGNQVRDEGGGQ